MGSNLETRDWQVASHFLGILTFMVFFLIQTLPDPGYPWIGSLVTPSNNHTGYYYPEQVESWWQEGGALAALLWGLVHLRKFVLTLADSYIRYKLHNNEVVHQERYWWQIAFVCSSHLVGVLVVIYHTLFGLWLGWACNVYLGYTIPDLYLAALGLFLYFFAETTIVCLFVALKMRKGFLHNNLWLEVALHVSEIFTWVGVTLTLMTLACLLLMVSRTILAMILVYKTIRTGKAWIFRGEDTVLTDDVDGKLRVRADMKPEEPKAVVEQVEQAKPPELTRTDTPEIVPLSEA